MSRVAQRSNHRHRRRPLELSPSLRSRVERPCVVADEPCVVESCSIDQHFDGADRASVVMRGAGGTMRVLDLEGAAARWLAERVQAGTEVLHKQWRVIVMQTGEVADSDAAVLFRELKDAARTLYEWELAANRMLDDANGQEPWELRAMWSAHAEAGSEFLRHARSAWLRAVMAEVDCVEELYAARRTMRRAADLLETIEGAARLVGMAK
jgi:hypothetical protein